MKCSCVGIWRPLPRGWCPHGKSWIRHWNLLSTYWNTKYKNWNFQWLFFFFNFCGDKSPFCGATGAPCFRLRLTLPMGLKARVDPSSAALCSCLCIMTLLRVNSEFPGLDLSQFYTLVWCGYRWEWPMSNVTYRITGRGKIRTEDLVAQSPADALPIELSRPASNDY